MTGGARAPRGSRVRKPASPPRAASPGDAAPRAWFVYLIECRGGSIYTGVAIDVAARFAAHAEGRGARYTRSHPPLRLLAAFPCATRSAALRAEIRIKRLSATAKRALGAGGVLPD